MTSGVNLRGRHDRHNPMVSRPISKNQRDGSMTSRSSQETCTQRIKWQPVSKAISRSAGIKNLGLGRGARSRMGLDCKELIGCLCHSEIAMRRAAVANEELRHDHSHVRPLVNMG